MARWQDIVDDAPEFAARLQAHLELWRPGAGVRRTERE